MTRGEIDTLNIVIQLLRQISTDTGSATLRACAGTIKIIVEKYEQEADDAHVDG